MRVIDKIESPINGKIKVTSFFGQKSVWIGGFQQSGSLISRLWDKFLNNINLLQCKNVLILGLGCGSAVKPVLKRFPKVKIIGVEIDPLMIAIGKKYFDLDKYENLKVVCSDGTAYCKITNEKFDLILVDMYKGNVSEKLDKHLSKLLNPGGKGIINELKGLENNAKYFF